MAELRITAQNRDEFGKGAARRLRREAKVPAVLYGHGIDPVHLSLPGHDMMLALKNSNALLTIVMTSGVQLALAKAVQRDPIRGFLEHVDLLAVRRGEKVTVDVRVHLEGEPQLDTLVNQELTTLSLEAEATNIPESVTVSIAGLGVGDSVSAADVGLPQGTSLVTEPDHTVVSILAVPTAEQLEAELAEAEAEAGIEHEPAEAEAAAEEESAEGERAGTGDQSADAGSGSRSESGEQ
ncbi:MAG: 50S ribosomal protein L25/general stress protein Ctc [Mycobacteriales bacterium]|nr:MAG: 50S ribosomal protein L25 [Pseudonocardiales bacterium]